MATIDSHEDGFDWIFLSVFVVTTAAYAYVIYAVSRRQNWARIAILALTALFVGATLLWPVEIGVDPWWSILLMVASTIADVVALILLFSGAGHAWFKKVGA